LYVKYNLDVFSLKVPEPPVALASVDDSAVITPDPVPVNVMAPPPIVEETWNVVEVLLTT
jgi:hypothetical protein